MPRYGKVVGSMDLTAEQRAYAPHIYIFAGRVIPLPRKFQRLDKSASVAVAESNMLHSDLLITRRHHLSLVIHLAHDESLFFVALHRYGCRGR